MRSGTTLLFELRERQFESFCATFELATRKRREHSLRLFGDSIVRYGEQERMHRVTSEDRCRRLPEKSRHPTRGEMIEDASSTELASRRFYGSFEARCQRDGQKEAVSESPTDVRQISVAQEIADQCRSGDEMTTGWVRRSARGTVPTSNIVAGGAKALETLPP